MAGLIFCSDYHHFHLTSRFLPFHPKGQHTCPMVQSPNQGSFRISLAEALADGSNRSNFRIICPSLAISSPVKSSLRSPSKYASSSHSCNPDTELSLPIPLRITSHLPSHLSGSASPVVSCIWPTRIWGVIKMLSKGGWPTKSSKSYMHHIHAY